VSTPMDTQHSTDAQSGTAGQEGTAAAIAQEARGVAASATSATQDVAQTAKEQATQVAGEATAHAKDLMAQAKDEVTVQVEQQTVRLAGTLRSTAQELQGMAVNADPGSTAQQVVQTLADKGTRLADVIEQRGPGGLVQSLQDLGRRRPGTFLLGAMAAGVVAGRFARAAKSAGTTQSAPTSPPSAQPLPGTQGRPLPGTESLGPTMGSDLGYAEQPAHTVVLPETGHRTR